MGQNLHVKGEFVVVEGEKTYNDQLIVWFNQAINCCIIILIDKLWSTQTQNTEFSVVLMKIPNF